METTPIFHIGIANTHSKRKKKEKQKPKKGRLPKAEPSYRWRIIPCSSTQAITIDTLPGNSYITKKQGIKEFGHIYLNPPKSTFVFPTFESSKKMSTLLRELRDSCAPLIEENQRLRWIFKRFLNKWRFQNAKRVNDIDFCTLEAFKIPVFLMNFPKKTLHTFEADSILSDIHKKLLQHSGQIPTPIAPRNPYTNEPFTQSQLIHLFSQLKEKGRTRWTLELFRKYKFNMEQFILYERKNLRIHALKSMLSSLKEWDGLDLMVDFIETHHLEHNASFSKNLYIWSIMNIEDDPRISEWIRLCREYHMRDILTDDPEEKEILFAEIRGRTGSLCSPPHDLMAKRGLFLKMKKDGSSISSL